MRRRILALVGLLVSVASCTDVTRPTERLLAPAAGHYQLTPSGTLADEIPALIMALFPKGLETAAGTRWTGITALIAKGDLAGAKTRLIDLSRWITQKTTQMDTPPDGETRQAAAARLVLYMSLYVFNGPTTPPPAQFGGGADATVGIISPEAPAVLRTPLEHAGARFEAGTVSEPTIVVISQNTQFFTQHCEGPFTTKYCQYPLFYHYQAFPVQRFLKSVHTAVCHVETGGLWGPLAGVNHDNFVEAHDKPASSANYTPGGYPVPGEGIELLPRASTFNAADPLIDCDGAVYPQVALVTYPTQPNGFVGTALASAARGVNRAASALSAALAPKTAYAIDNGAETLTDFFSTFVNVDTIGRPDLAASGGSPTPATAAPGTSVTVSYTLANNGAAPSLTNAVSVQLVPIVYSYVPTPVPLTVASSTGGSLPLYPLQSRTQTVTVNLPSSLAAGSYNLLVSVASSSGQQELTSTTSDNGMTVPLTVSGLGEYGSVGVDGVFSPGEWDESKCASLPVNLPGGGTTTGLLCWKNTATDLYFGWKVALASDIATADFSVTFDKDGSNSVSVNDDAIVANRQAGYFDDVYTACVVEGVPQLCGFMDSSSGGTNDGTEAWSYSGGYLVAEGSHPLTSGDYYDIAMSAGDAIGIHATLRLISGPNLADTEYPSSGFYTTIQTYPPPIFLSASGGGDLVMRAAAPPTRPARRGVAGPRLPARAPTGMQMR